MQNLPGLYALTKDEGQAIWFLNTLAFIKLTSKQTGGAFGLMEEVCPVGTGSPYHMHHNEDETFYILEGEVTFICGDHIMKANGGSVVFLPRNIPHGFRVDAPARLLIVATPGGFEQFVVEAGELAKEPVLPPSGPPDMEKLMALSAKYKVDILGPLPEM